MVDAVSLVATMAAGVSAAFAAVSAWISARTLRDSKVDQSSKHMLDQAVLSLERAYAAIENKDDPGGLPIRDRVAWLTAARLLKRYEEMKCHVVLDGHRVILEEQEDHWRLRFYTVLAPLVGSGGLGFYGRQGALNAVDAAKKIEPASAVVVHCFALWPEGKADPLQCLKRGAISEDAKFLAGNLGLSRYLQEGGYIAESVQSPK